MTKDDLLAEINDFLEANGIDHNTSPKVMQHQLNTTTLAIDAVELLLELAHEGTLYEATDEEELEAYARNKPYHPDDDRIDQGAPGSAIEQLATVDPEAAAKMLGY